MSDRNEDRSMSLELYYWDGLQGRGEFVRLALEEAGADYVDVARGSESDGRGVPAMMALMNGDGVPHPPFAPPFLRDGTIVVTDGGHSAVPRNPSGSCAPGRGQPALDPSNSADGH